MPSRTQRRFANVLVNSPAGARMRATQLDAVGSGQEPESSSSSGVTFTYYRTSSTTVDPIYGPNGNVWFSDGSTVGEFVPGTQQILEGTAVNGLVQELAADNAGNVWFGI
ncbi:MAG: hypothetical protein ACJ8J0_19155, partial [Longimicrobiaceae bacterium]